MSDSTRRSSRRGPDGLRSPSFGALRLEPYHLRVFPRTPLLEGRGELHQWSQSR